MHRATPNRPHTLRLVASEVRDPRSQAIIRRADLDAQSHLRGAINNPSTRPAVLAAIAAIRNLHTGGRSHS